MRFVLGAVHGWIVVLVDQLSFSGQLRPLDAICQTTLSTEVSWHGLTLRKMIRCRPFFHDGPKYRYGCFAAGLVKKNHGN